MAKLSFWRKRGKKIGVHLVFWPIIAVFVIWGFERMGNPAGSSAATVNGEAISVAEYRRALQRMVDMYSQFSKESMDEEAMKRYHIREAAIQQLVNSELLMQEGAKMGLEVTDREVAETVTQMPYLKKDGKFSKELYDLILKSNNLSPNQFESGLRKELLLDKTRSLFEKNVVESSLALQKQSQMQSKKMELEFLKINTGDIAKHVDVSQSDVDAYLKEKTSAAKIKEYYDLQQAEFKQGEQARASHILVKAKKGDAKEEKSALDKVKDIQNQLKAKSFAELAKKYSDDPGSKAQGGSLGWFEKGRMVPEFDKAVFSMKPGEVSAPVQTAFGYHIIKLEEKKSGKEITLDAATQTIAKRLVAQSKVEKILDDASQKNAGQAADTLKAWDKDLKWQSTGAFSISDEYIPQIGSDDSLSRDLMSLDEKHPSTGKVYKIGNSQFIVKFKRFVEDKKPTLAKANPEQAPINSLGRDVFSQWASKLSENAKITINKQLFSGDTGGGDNSAPGDM